MDCSLPGFSVHRILQARILEWAAMPFSKSTKIWLLWTVYIHLWSSLWDSSPFVKFFSCPWCSWSTMIKIQVNGLFYSSLVIASLIPGWMCLNIMIWDVCFRCLDLVHELTSPLSSSWPQRGWTYSDIHVSVRIHRIWVWKMHVFMVVIFYYKSVI